MKEGDKQCHVVAPHEGAWIEIWCAEVMAMVWPVAPHEGAWIEIRG